MYLKYTSPLKVEKGVCMLHKPLMTKRALGETKPKAPDIVLVSRHNKLKHIAMLSKIYWPMKLKYNICSGQCFIIFICPERVNYVSVKYNTAHNLTYFPVRYTDYTANNP